MKTAENPDVEIVELDMRGQICPSCMLLALKQVNEVAGELKQATKELHILTDSRQATSTIPEAVGKMGYQVDITCQDDAYHIRIHCPQQERVSL